MHSNLESVYKYIPLHVLPDEYLPDDYDGPSAGTIKSLTGMLHSFINWSILQTA